ncbi:MAG: trypsin-like peptidase domain-containing protein [Nocardioides sp.]
MSDHSATDPVAPGDQPESQPVREPTDGAPAEPRTFDWPAPNSAPAPGPAEWSEPDRQATPTEVRVSPTYADTEETQPLLPAAHLGQDAPAQRGDHEPPADTSPMAAFFPPSPVPQAAPAARGVLPGWVWPAIVICALIFGTLGGAIGTFATDRLLPDRGVAARPSTPTGSLPAVPAPLETDNRSIAAVAQRLLPSTVQVRAEFGGDGQGSTGSGFVLDDQGHIVTNNHVVAEAADNGEISVITQQGKTFRAEIVGRSPVYDLAVLEVSGAEGLTPASLGASQELQIGDGVVAIGSPLGLNATVTAGIVSALDRPVTTGSSVDDASYINAVQTDAAINPGNSGGPLVNLRGQVVGVNSAIATTGVAQGEAGNIGVGFAIPVEQVRTTAEQILATGEARYPVIGAKVDTDSGHDPGALISEIIAGSPAEAAGLRAGDLVTAIDGKVVTGGIELIVAIRTHTEGERVELTVQRNGSTRAVPIVLSSEIG